MTQATPPREMIDHAELARLARGAERHWSAVDIAIGGNPIAADPVGLFVGAMPPALVLALLAENAALRADLVKTERDYSELRDSYEAVSNKLCVERAHGGRETKRAAEAERKLAEDTDIFVELTLHHNLTPAMKDRIESLMISRESDQ